ncbi:MAG TPA: carbohydrate ABC transporter permease [Candidatus Limnocylindria bacterium]|nr:carbohydrate ABC transporter permease [Candidatus Limnocylindria bacterium]
MVAPFVWMLLGSFRSTPELRQFPTALFPREWTLENYTNILTRENFTRYFFNSTVVAVAITVGNLLFCSMVGYALAKLQFPGKRILFALVLVTLMVPGVVTFMPLFVLVSNLGLVNTHAALILPFLAGAFGVFLMRQFIAGIPDELLDAGRVDGAGEWYIFFRIVLPLSGAPLATLAILTFLGTWNSFLWPLVVAIKQDMYTLPVAVALFSTGQNQSDLGLQLASAVIVLAPVLVVFLFLQRYFTQGIAMTGIK